MKKLIAVAVLALLPLLAVADVAVPRERTDANAAETDSRAWPLVFLFAGGVAMVILIAARRRKSVPPVQ